MPEVNLTLGIDPEYRWWGARLLLKVPDSDLDMRARRKAVRTIVRDNLRPALRPLMNLRFWQILTYRVTDWGRVLTPEEYKAAVEKYQLAAFERKR